MPAGPRASTPGARREIWRAATQYIDEHLTQPLVLADIARAAFTSERQLQRVFAEHSAMNVRAYIQAARMRRASALVLGSDAPIGTIAAKVGYGHVSAFIKAFRVHYGVTPAGLRRQTPQPPWGGPGTTRVSGS